MRLTYVLQPKLNGTADATKLIEPYVKEKFLLIYGDLLVSAKVVDMVIRSYDKKPCTSIAVVSADNPERYGVVHLDGSYVTDIIEKPHRGEAKKHPVNAGIYVLETEIFEKVNATSLSSRGEYEITDSLRLLIKDGHNINAVKIPPEDWLDVGRPWDILEANHRVLCGIVSSVKGRIEEGVHLLGPVEIAEGARIRSGTYIEGPAFIDEKSDIGPNCFIRPKTSIGKGVRVGNACEIKNSVIMDETRISHLSYIGDSVIGEGCNLGAGSITANYRLDGKTVKMSVRDEVVDSKREKLGAIIGDKVKAGINTLLMPGVKIGSYSSIGPNVVIHRDVPPNTFILLKQKLKRQNI
jgi:bifunctional UDP-N-acetylglucosamine pyrophosphorylase/glucosamine-1-phosphate N-acetyltransferase